MLEFGIEIGKSVAKQSMHECHFHKYYEIYFLLKGNRRYFIDDGIYNLSKGDVALIEPDLLHKTVSVDDKPYTRMLIYFDTAILNPQINKELLSCFSARHMKIPKNRTEYIEDILMKAHNEFNKEDAFSNELLKGYITEILAFLSRTAQDKENIYIPDDIDESVLRATLFIRNNFDKDIFLRDVAQEANMSRTYFSAKFKECTGFGFCEFLNIVRIMNAEKLLITTNISITDVATKCGFNDSNYFAMIFKKMKGITPLKYRNSHFV